MAKQRKQKQKEHRSSVVGAAKGEEGSASCCSVVLHQKLCIAINIAAQRIYGHTELKVTTKQEGKIAGLIGLHAQGLHIEQVLVDGVEARFQFIPSQQQDNSHEGDLSNGSKSQMEAADEAYRKYALDLYREMQPELLIYPSNPSTPTDTSQEPESAIPNQGLWCLRLGLWLVFHSAYLKEATPAGSAGPTAVWMTSPQRSVVKSEAGVENGFSQTAPDLKPDVSNAAAVPATQPEDVRLVRVDYWVEKPSAGAHFEGSILHTNNQLRRARCWFPCVDSGLQRCSFDLEFTVNSEYVAVSNGKLLHQVYSKQGTHLKTYVYSLTIPTVASSISLVVAPLIVLPDRHNPTVSHLCLPGYDSTLQCSVSFFHSVFSLYEEYLGAPFPFGCYKQVFIPGDTAISSTSVGASMTTLSADLLADEHIIDQAIGTRIKLAYALAQQWFGIFITAETSADEWLLEGLAGCLTDLFIKRFLGNNEARFRRFKANEAVCLVEVEGAPVLSPPLGLEINTCGTEKLGVLGKIRTWKATAVVQMLEKQMGPEPFRKVLQRIIMRAQDPARHARTLSTTEFRHFANKLGNLERPFLKDFFPRWVESSGCPRLRMGFVYSKRRNMVELAIRRESTAVSQPLGGSGKAENPGGKLRVQDMGWPGMMSIRLHELDGMYDHPSLPMAGDRYQLLELQCHSKLAGRRIQRPKKGSKTDALDDNVEATPAQGLESPLLWLRADPELEYLAELNLLQPEHMWINQLEKDRDVVGQVQAVAALRAHSRTSFALVNALNNCLTDAKVFCRVRMEAAAALASTATESTSWVGLQNLIKYYKSRRFDPDIGLPRSNDFHDFAEYFVLEAIPGAVAEVRGSDGKSPPEAADFILHILKHNDNNGNAYSDVYWLASVIESIGSIEFGHQNLRTLSRMLKQIDRFLQYDRLMPSYNGVVTISCIHTLTKLAIRFSHALPLGRIAELLEPFKEVRKTRWQVRVAALEALVNLENHSKGLEEAVVLALNYIDEDPSLRVQSKVMKHVLHLGTIRERSNLSLGAATISRLLSLLESTKAFQNVLLRNHVFSFIQVLAGRSASVYRSAENWAKMTSTHSSQVKKFVKSKPGSSTFKVRLRPVEAPRPEPIRLRLVLPGASKDNAERTESANTGVTRELDEQKVGRFKLKLKVATSSSAQENAGEDGSQAMEVSTGAVTLEPVTPTCQVSVKEEILLPLEVIDSNPFTQFGLSEFELSQPPELNMDEPSGDHHGFEMQENTEDVKLEETEEAKYNNPEADDSLKEPSQGRYISQSNSLAVSEELPFNLNGEDTLDGMIEVKGELTQDSDMMEVGDIDRFKSILDVAGGTESTHDGGGEDRVSQKREKKERKHEKKEKRDKKDRKEKKKKKHDKHNDPEYLEKKRKRKEEKEHRHHEEGRKSVKVEEKSGDLDEKAVQVEEKPVKVEERSGDVSVGETAKPEGDKKLRFKIKKIRLT